MIFGQLKVLNTKFGILTIVLKVYSLYILHCNMVYSCINFILTIHLTKAFKAVENNARENPDKEFKKYHGFDGLLHVQDSPSDIYEIIKDVFKVAKNLGIPYNN